MKDTAYAFCVARIRANEARLLNEAFMYKLAEASDYNSAVAMLSEIGWIDGGECISDYISAQNEKLWMLLLESVPDKNELNSLCVLNDFFNIKCAVKCVFTGDDAEKYFISPTSLNLDELIKAVKSASFEKISDSFVTETLKEAYEIACKTENGQNAEIIIDNATLKLLMKYSQKYKSTVFSEICAFTVDTANIKTAFRCVYTNKNSDFIESAISECFAFERCRLVDSITQGTDAVSDYLSNTKYSEGISLYLKSPALFDKWCDDKIIEIAKKSKYTAFGFDPVCAYYYAKLSEIKTVRIILTSKQSGVSVDRIKERVRASYV